MATLFYHFKAPHWIFQHNLLKTILLKLNIIYKCYIGKIIKTLNFE